MINYRKLSATVYRTCAVTCLGGAVISGCNTSISIPGAAVDVSKEGVFVDVLGMSVSVTDDVVAVDVPGIDISVSD